MVAELAAEEDAGKFLPQLVVHRVTWGKVIKISAKPLQESSFSSSSSEMTLIPISLAFSSLEGPLSSPATR